MRSIAPAVLAVAVIAAPAAAEELLGKVAPCVGDRDRAMCILRVVAQEDGGSDVWRDDELRSQPSLMAQLGISPRQVAIARGADSSGRMFFGAMDDGAAAVDEALALDRAGRPPEEALRPILELSDRNPQVPLFFMPQGEMPSPRFEGFSGLLSDEARPERRPSPALTRAAADAWERELARPGQSPEMRGAAAHIAKARLATGDEAGFRRALNSLRPTDRVELLADTGRLEEAAAAAVSLTLPEVLAEERENLDALVARARRIDPQLPAPRPREAELAADAKRKLGETYDKVLFTAQQLKRPHLAAPVAERFLADPGTTQNRYRFIPVLLSLPRARATAVLEELEMSLSPGRGADRVDPIVRGWIALDEPARADALIARLLPWVQGRGGGGYRHAVASALIVRGRAEEGRRIVRLDDRDLLRAAAAGRVVQRVVDAELATLQPNQRSSLLITCASAAREARDWEAVLYCDRLSVAQAETPRSRFMLAGRILSDADAAAYLGGDDAAAKLVDLGLRTARDAIAADGTVADETMGGPNSFHLIRIAKAELRATGRLPPAKNP